MPNMTTIWTALPNGFNPVNGRLRLSVYVSMRLTGGASESQLGAFGAALDWPGRVAAGSLTLQAQAPGLPPQAVTIVSAAPEPALWRELFPATTRVVSYAFDDLTRRPINTYSAAAVHDNLRNGHQRISSSSPVASPSASQLRDAYPGLHLAFQPAALAMKEPGAAASEPELRAFHGALSRSLFAADAGRNIHANVETAVRISRSLAATGAHDAFTPVIADDGTLQSQFAQLYAFHHRAPASSASAPTPDPARVLDFHQTLSALAQYPALLRRLGLAFDLELAESQLPLSPLSAASGRLKIVPSFTPAADFAVVNPLTAYILDGGVLFTPAPRDTTNPETVGGLLNLALAGQYALNQIDVDGLGLKAINLIASGVQSEPDDDAGLPTTGSMGLSVLRVGSGATLTKRVANAQSNNAALGQPGHDITLFDEDVTRGLRFDVFDGANWRSLHKRRGHYAPTGAPGAAFDVADEGFSQASVATRLDGSADVQAQLYVHDSLMRWNGWSLAAPHPGKSLGSDGPGDFNSQPPPGGVNLAVNFVAEPTSLPRLRFGTKYQLRARAVDLAGNSLGLDEATERMRFLHDLNRPAPTVPARADDFTYRRFEPVAAPALVARARFREGESTARLVIRSNANESAADCAIRLTRVVAASRPAEAAIYREICDRHIVPPKIALSTALQHGLLDAAFGAAPASGRLYHLASKEKGRFSDAGVIDAATGAVVPIPPVSVTDPVTGGAVVKPAVELAATSVDGKKGYVLHREAQMRTPYLPDPLSRGATFCNAPGLTHGQSAAIGAQGSLGVSTSDLPPATLAVLTSILRIDFGPDWPERLPFRLEIGEQGAGDPKPVWDAAKRVLRLALGKAEQTQIRLSSFFAETDLDLLGLWRWALDRNAALGLPPPDAGDAATAAAGGVWMLSPFTTLDIVHAVQQPLLAPQFAAAAATRDAGATFAYLGAKLPVHGKSTARLDILARWQETVDDPAQPGPVQRKTQAHVLELDIHLPGETGSGPPGPAVGVYDDASGVATFEAKPAGDASGRVFLSRHEFGDTRGRKVFYRGVAASRFREYFPPELVDETSLAGDEFALSVPASARPQAPNPLYALPYFQWSRTVENGTLVRVRKAGIRVYLDRPWFSSGDGEMLGVVLAAAANYPPPAARLAYATQWGGDPIWDDQTIAGAPAPANFPRGVAVASGLLRDEVATETVTVVGHTVEFDADRRLWSCDIAVEGAAAYRPFVRLALARYQPNALPGMELSRIALAEFAQILPQRRVTFAPVSGQANVHDLAVTGAAYTQSAWRPSDLQMGPTDKFLHDVRPRNLDAPALVTVRLQERVPNATDEAGWRAATAGSVAVSSSAPADAPSASGPALWSGRVTLPASAQPGQFRVLIVEEERLSNDDRSTEQVIIVHKRDPEVPHDTDHTFHQPVTLTPGGSRLVFVETIEL